MVTLFSYVQSEHPSGLNSDLKEKLSVFRLLRHIMNLAILFAVCGLLIPALDASPSSGVQGSIASNGRATEVIVVGDSVGPSDRFVAMATKFSEIIDDPSDLGVLYRICVYMIDGTDIVLQFMENIDAFHHGQPYLNPVPLEKLFAPLPRIQHGRL